MNKDLNQASAWVPPVVGKMTETIAASQAAHAREVKRKYIESEQRGFQSGLDKAKFEIEKQTQTERQALSMLLANMANPLHELETAALQEIKKFVCEALKLLSYHAFEQNDVLVHKVVEEGLAALPAQSKEVIVRLHPKDVARVKDLLASQNVNDFKKLHVVEDANLKPGDVIFKTQDADLDGTIATRVERIMAEVLSEPEHE